jgi:hypothetical protein
MKLSTIFTGLKKIFLEPPYGGTKKTWILIILAVAIAAITGLPIQEVIEFLPELSFLPMS